MSEQPKNTDIGWNDYVLSLFDESELVNGSPRVHGLRRIATLLIGPIVESRLWPAQTPDPSNGNRATIVHTVCIYDNNLARDRTYEGVVDVCVANKGERFGVHPAATADTIAEGRALKRALMVSFSAYEEISNSPEQLIEEEMELAEDGQISAINKLCKRLDIDPKKLGHTIFGDGFILLKKEDAITVLSEVNKYQQGTEIPEDIRGFVSTIS